MQDKKVTEMTDRELMEALVEGQRSETKFTRIAAFANIALAAVLILTIIILVPRALSTLSQTEKSLREFDALAAQAESSLSDIDELVTQGKSSLADIEKLAKDADQVVEDNANALSEAMENFNKVDFDSLNSSIEELGRVASGLNSIGSLFGR